ncbi:MAG: LacI family DNA-binding transcriptional regulator [Peptoniphilaceae bacterium]|nr:LacI family DNA-binding transcriptional regulator [Peptoniphilaceae bacterium]MDY6018474.1 LacI family DNA-binding transcriptional regulator [Anaerococcus sp.]
MSTIKDVAKLAGVSITTVSMVLNKTNHKISETTRKKVISAAEKLEYKPNNIARSLVTKKTNSIMLIIPDLINPFFAYLSNQIAIYAEKLGYILYIYNSHNKLIDEKSFVNLIERNYIEASLIVDRRVQSFDKKINEKYNIVFLDEFDYQNADVNIVTGDNEKGGYLATSYLLDKGFSNIGLNIGPHNTPNSTRRLSGSLKCMIDKDIEYDPKNIFHGDYSFEGGYKAGKYFVEKGVDAIFSFSDLSTYGILNYFYKKGVRVPDDISIISYDNLQMNKLIIPKLTSVDQDIDKIAKESINMVDRLVKHKLIDRKILVSPKIVEAESVRE